MSYGNPNRHTDCEELGSMNIDRNVSEELRAWAENRRVDRAEINALRAQNTELLAALRVVINGWPDDPHLPGYEERERTRRQYRSLIARIEAAP